MKKINTGTYIIFAIATFLYYLGICTAQYIPTSEEERNFTFSNSGETASIGSGKIFVLDDVLCEKGAQDGIAVISDTSGFALRSPIYNTATSVSNTAHYDEYVFSGTLTFGMSTSTKCYYTGKEIYFTKWKKFSNHYNGIDNINDWIDEITGNQSKIFGLANFFIVLLFEYILFFSSITYGFIYGFRFFNGKKQSD